MINPEIREEYGEDGERILSKFCDTLTEEERDSIYAVDHHPLSKVSGLFMDIASDNTDLVDTLSVKVMQYVLSLDNEAISTCDKYNGEGIKVWLTTL